MGKPKAQAVGEVQFCGAIYGFYAENAESLMADEPIELLGGRGTAMVRRSPYGALLGIMPWNYPYYQVARFAGPNLMIGNPILLKHAPQCPESAAAMQAIFDEAGFPEGCYENVYATNEQIEWVIADPRMHGVSVTGSERAGAAVAEIAGRNLKKVVLEMGGSDPFIVLDVDDLDAVADTAVTMRLGNTGQACNSAKRFIVTDEHYDEFLAKLKDRMEAAKPGDPTAEGTAIGPLSSKTAADRLEDQVKRAIDGGAEVLVGGGRDGNFFEPTILTGIEQGSEASQEEFFGPVAQVYKVGSEEEAIEPRQRHPVRARLLPDDQRQGAGRAGRERDRSRDGLHQRDRRRRRRAPLRRRQAQWLRPRARPLRRRRVRQQEVDPRRLRELRGGSGERRGEIVTEGARRGASVTKTPGTSTGRARRHERDGDASEIHELHDPATIPPQVEDLLWRVSCSMRH